MVMAPQFDPPPPSGCQLYEQIFDADTVSDTLGLRRKSPGQRIRGNWRVLRACTHAREVLINRSVNG